MRGCFAICICGYHIVGEGFPLPSRRRLQTLAHLHIPPAPLSLSICKAKALRFATSVQIPKPRTIKNTLRFELHFRLCFGKADGADNLRLELLRGFRDSSRIAFFGTFFSKKKVHKDKEMRLKISQRRARRNEHSFSHDFVVPAPSQREP